MRATQNRHDSWTIAGIAGVCCMSAISILAQTIEPSSSFQSTVDFVSLNVTVTDQSRECLTASPAYWNAAWDGCLVRGLSENAFRITEDGVQQTITAFHGTEVVRISLAVVIDARSSAQGRATEVHETAKRLTGRLRASDSAALMASTPNMLANMLLHPNPSLPRPASITRREAIVFMTDTRSPLEPNILAFARRPYAVVYVIGLTGNGILEESREPAVSLRRLANTTGGRAFFPSDARRLPAVYNQIYDELVQQYMIGYVSTNTPA